MSEQTNNSDEFIPSFLSDKSKWNLESRNLNHSTMIFDTGRKKISLNKNWRFVPDQYECSIYGEWFNLKKPDSGFPYDYKYDYGFTVDLPSVWNLVKKEYFLYEGSAWYAKQFQYIKIRTDERVVLRIGAANYDTRIFLNSVFVGNHAGGSTPFYADITDLVQADNVLQLLVNNTRKPERVPAMNTDWFNYGGVYRDVELLVLPAAYIKQFEIFLLPDNQFRNISIKIRVQGKNDANKAVVRIPEIGIEGVLEPVNGFCEKTVSADITLWSPENPKLYDIHVAYGDDVISDRVGFRQITVSGKDILLNGKRIFLKGICAHEDDAKTGKVTSEKDIRRRFSHAKELGCNFMRLAHYPHHERAAQIADEIGLLLWEEIPVYWQIDFNNESTYNDAENQLLELIKRDYNRASVIIWSIGNENWDSDPRLAFMTRLAKKAKETDPSRLVSAACFAVDYRIVDRLQEYLDLIGINQYIGWYDQGFEKLKAFYENVRECPKPVIISETGAGACAGHRSGQSSLFSEDYMVLYYSKQAEAVLQTKSIQGFAPWILYDFRAPHRQNKYQQGYNRKGLIAQDKKTRKKAFFILKRLYEQL